MLLFNNTAKNRSYKVWHLIITVLGMGTMMSAALGTLPDPSESSFSQQQYMGRTYLMPAERDLHQPLRIDKPVVEVLPFNLCGEVPSPLLASILKRYMPHSQPVHADGLRDTLPPGQNPRMIVILPEEDDAKPVF